VAVRCRTIHRAAPSRSVHHHHPRWGPRQYRFTAGQRCPSYRCASRIAIAQRIARCGPSNIARKLSSKTGWTYSAGTRHTDPVSYACPNGHEWDIEFENGTSSLRIYIISSFLRLGHVGEARQMQLMRNGDGLRRPIPVLAQNQVSFTAAWVVTLERIGPVQKYDHIGILL
jgi:hypothetical protein